MKWWIGGACLALASCSIYRSEFDCPAGKGIGCKPVNEVLEMIVEQEEGEDVFTADPQQAARLRNKKPKKRLPPVLPAERKKLYLLKERSGDSVLVEAEEGKGKTL